MKIIGLTGTIGAGKGEAVEYLKQKGFRHFSARAFLAQEVMKRDLEPVRDSLFLVANELRDQFGPAYIVEMLYNKAAESGVDCVIESIRTLGEVELLKAQPNFTLLALDADPKLRYERIMIRNSETDHITFEKFQEDEEKEMSSEDPHKQNLSGCIKKADFMILNNGSIEKLHETLDEVLARMPH